MDILKLADGVVTAYAFGQLTEAVERVERTRKKQSPVCLCRNCIFSAVNEANQWIKFVGEALGMSELILYDTIADAKGNIEITCYSYTRGRRR